MDFDYQKIKEAESRSREERMISHPLPPPRPSLEACLKPPVKPRRSLRGRPACPDPQNTHHPPTTPHRDNQVCVKRVSPALVLGSVGPLEPLSACLRAHTLLWFHNTQLPRLQKPGLPLPRWLHGFATRREAEELLQEKMPGCFLLRLSESKIGFVLSYRGEDRCRHFIIEEESCEASGVVYLIAGENSRHKSLEELLSFYTYNPVGPFSECLTVPCEKTDEEQVLVEISKEAEGTGTASEEKVSIPAEAPGPAAPDSLPTNPCAAPPPSSSEVQYAAVKKPPRETVCPAETAPPTQQNGDSSERPWSADPPYARVNKPPRVCPRRGSAPSVSRFQATASDVGYCQLESNHTYEETPHSRSPDDDDDDDEVHSYTTSSHRQTTEDQGAGGNHEYSEVNIRGAPARPRPGLPLRPPPRALQGQPGPESGQSSSVPPLTAQGSRSPPSSVYEQIPDRPRPALPPR